MPAPNSRARAPWRRSARRASRKWSSARPRFASAKADVSAAAAPPSRAQLDVGFTRVLAPISGQVSERRVDPGNAVTADETVLTTDRLDEPAPFRLRRVGGLLLRYPAPEWRSAGTGAPVRIRLQDEAQYVHAGRLDFVDNARSTPARAPSVARAVVPNPDGFLKAGHDGPFAARRPRRPIGRCWCPTPRSSPTRARRVVYVVDRAGQGRRPSGPARSADRQPARDPHAASARSDRVIIDGLQRAMPGQKVKLAQRPDPAAVHVGADRPPHRRRLRRSQPPSARRTAARAAR